MKRRIVMSMLAGGLAGTLLGAGPARAADPPAEFGTDWHDPLTESSPVTRPAGESCRVTARRGEVPGLHAVPADVHTPARPR